jgi:hypothetical protein
MHDSGYIFQHGPVNGKAFWPAAPVGNDLLSWEPVFASVAASGNLGYTTGPWQYRANCDDTTGGATGCYVSGWNKDGAAWEVVLEIGISFPLQQMSKESVHRLTSTPRKKPIKGSAGKEELLSMEHAFVKAQDAGGAITFTSYR